MPTLNIEGKRVKVDDSFLTLSPEEQQRTVEEIAQQIGAKPRNDAPQTTTADGRDNALGMVDTFVRGMADTSGLGFADEISAGLGTGFGFLGDYDKELARQRAIDDSDYQNRFGTRLAGQIGGGLLGGYGLARLGLSFAGNAARAGAGLGRVAMGSAADGAILGGAQGVGSGEGVGDRLTKGAVGSSVGTLIGGAAPYAIAGVSEAGRAVAAPLMARVRPQPFANRALSAGLNRAGMSPDDVAAALTRAQADDQGMFTVADAMGHSGQRMLSTVARNPNDMRQQVVDALISRQMGQGERLSRTLAEGFNAQDTAAQRAASLAAERNNLAGVNYANASAGAKPVNLTGAIDKIDRLLGRDPILGETALSRGPMGLRLKALRAQMQRNGEQLVDFDRIVALKSDLYQQMKRNPDVANEMRPVYELLDGALENASPTYRAANDAYRAQSRTIDAVDAGTVAASGRTRAADNIQRFNAMEPGERMAFRAGYSDPMIARVEASSISPSTNKARPLMTEKTGQEFPAFAIPQRVDKMGRRIAREQRMFETANAALGGSKTADNLADAAEMAKFDPGVFANLLRGRPIAAAVDAVAKMASEAKGMPPAVMDRIAKTLLETRPDVARQMLRDSGTQAAIRNGRRALANAILVNMSASAPGRLIGAQ